MNFRLMYKNIKEFCPELSVAVIKQRINIRYQQIVAGEDWAFLYDTTTVRLIDQHENIDDDNEYLTVVQGDAAVTGTGTTFTSTHVGYYIRLEDESQPYIISSVTDNTHITLETSYGNAGTTSGYTLYPATYSPSVGDVGEISQIIYDTPLIETSEGALARLDPERDSTGEPERYRVFAKTKATGTASFEIWPIADGDYVVTVAYKKTVDDLSDDTDEPVFRPEILEAGSLYDCYRMSFNKTQNPAYIGLARDALKDFNTLYRQLIEEDFRTSSMPTSVRDVTSDRVWTNDFYTDHDTEPW